MDEDLIVVDDHEEIVDISTPSAPEPEPGTLEAFSGQRLPKTVAEHALAAGRPRRHMQSPSISSMETPERGARSMASEKASSSKPAPKLKLKLSEKAAALAPGNSFLGPYDRELDSDDEDLAFEEQFILRMPPGEDCERMRKLVSSREVSNDIWFKFKDSRRATFQVGKSSYSAKLVDLPSIIESQKTLDNKQMFKVADICQMLVVEDKVDTQDAVPSHRNFNVDEFIWPHGITPPLQHVRKRRFRKRMNKRTIESVEEQVENLMMEDDLATSTTYEFLENVNPDWSDSEFIERDEPLDPATPAPGSEAGDAPTPGGGPDNDDSDEEEADEPEGDIDEELAAELDLALVDDDGKDDDDDDDDSDDEDEDEDEDEEDSQTRSLLNEEIRDLEAAVAKKTAEIASSGNPLIKKRFEDALKKLSTELDMKIAQRDEMKEQRRMRREGVDPDSAKTGSREESVVEEDDLFGDEDMA